MPTLFFDTQTLVYDFQNRYQKTISLEFANCADIQLTNSFELITGLKVNKQISIATRPEWEFFVEMETISKMPFSIYVNHNWNPVTILWKSKSGRIYEIHDTDIECNDIEFWFEELDVALIHRQISPGDKLPFKIKNLSYELVITRINMDCTIELRLREDNISNAESIISQIDNFIAGFNENSLKKDRKYGVIHHWKPTIEGDKLIYDIDLGSTGPLFFKKLFPELSQLNYFTRVEIC
jgi:ASC-1-like (ASCH) protein